MSLELSTKIKNMFEYMTLVADPTLFDADSEEEPSPSGVPMGIVTMPDFVLDVALDGIESVATDRGHIQTMDVGGRAGRLAWVLQDFGGQQNGWYSVRYVAKAGQIGHVVLEQRFGRRRHDDGRTVEPITLRYIVPSKRGTDWLHVYGSTRERIESPQEEFGVTPDDFEAFPHTLRDIFVDARYIVIGSKRAKYAIQAIEIVERALTNILRTDKGTHKLKLGIMLDLSALTETEPSDTVISAFSAFRNRISGITIEATALCNADSIPTNGCVDHTLIRTEEFVSLLGVENPWHVQTKLPVSREAFTAGYVLASACSLGWEALRTWNAYFPSIRPINSETHDGYPKQANRPRSCDFEGTMPSLNVDAPSPLSITERIEFAVELAKRTQSKPLHYGEFLAKLGENGPISSASANLALNRRFSSDDHKDTRSLFVSPSDITALSNSCEIRDIRRSALPRFENHEPGFNRAVLFDLDATLIDSSGMLRVCWLNGLRRFFTELKQPKTNEELQNVFAIYRKYIYANHERFSLLLRDHPAIASELQPCDFRQVWNHPYAWVALLWILSTRRDTSLDAPVWSDDSWETIKKDHETCTTASHNCTICQRLVPLLEKNNLSVDDRRDATQELRDLLVEFKFEIKEGMNAFWSEEYPCLSQARACVEMIQAIPGCRVYVVTEGHEDTQLQKLKCTGLDDLFPRSRVLSTSTASAADSGDLGQLLRTTEMIEKRIKKGAHADYPFGRTRSVIRFFQELLQDLYSKANKKFYCAVIDAILLNPESPSGALGSLHSTQEWLRRRTHSGTRFFMIGDRYDNDCEPLLDLNLSNGERLGIGTCRLLSGKRATMDCPPDRSKDNKARKPTMFVADTLLQVAHILQMDSVWSDISDVAMAPPVLLEFNLPRELGSVSFRMREGSETKVRRVPKPLTERFSDLTWAYGNKEMQREPAVRGMLLRIARELAAGTVDNLASFLDHADVVQGFSKWWGAEEQEHSSADPDIGTTALEITDIKDGTLKFLTEINQWRVALKRPLLRRPYDIKSTLEWRLGSAFLAASSTNNIVVKGNALSGLRGVPVDQALALDILHSLPYSEEGLSIVNALPPHQRLVHFLHEWKDRAMGLPRTDARSASV